MKNVRPATVEDAFSLAPRLRKGDLEELYAAGHEDPLIALVDSVICSTEAYAYEDSQGVVQALGGIADCDILAAPWLLGSDDMTLFRKHLLHHPRLTVQRWATQYPLLMNYVHCDNKASILWLRRLGFTIHPPVPYQRGTFHPFTLRSNPNV